MTHPFSTDEIYRAVRLVSPPAVSEVVARTYAANWDDRSDLTQDTLILLSLLSPEMERKVDRYRRMAVHTRPAEFEQHWELHRAALRTAIATRHRERADH